jgi:hypothetical protein
MRRGFSANLNSPRRAHRRLWLCGLLGLSSLNAAHAVSLAGQQIQPGGKIEIHFPVSKYFQDIASQAGNPRPENGRAVLTFPAGFDPSRPWPILIVTSTSDFDRTSAMDVDWYRRPATAEGWIVLGPDATIKPHLDSTNGGSVYWAQRSRRFGKSGRNPPDGRSRSPGFPEARSAAASWA